MKYTIAFIEYHDMSVEVGHFQTENWDEVISFLTEEVLFGIHEGIDPEDLFEDEENFSRDTVKIFRGDSHEVVDYPRETVIPLVRQKLEEEDRKRKEQEREIRERDDRETFERLKAKYGE